ncbi:hypothetical protein SAY87_000925 [Trapa incisa]|uniref:Uncharacterized protein n=1 Tax=Trapa incisa TaxID=236973 RepID=A0AAN7GJN7_9MYRT|nr:hypothetical protein SAY87_000925 [Trapa incisa]
MGYAVPRNEFDGSFTSASVSESLRKVMVEKEGCYRVNTKMEEVIRDRQLQEGYVDNFLNYLKSTRPRRERKAFPKLKSGSEEGAKIIKDLKLKHIKNYLFQTLKVQSLRGF